jgi:hypothetical protein
MPIFVPNQSVAAQRSLTVKIYETDGVTPMPAASINLNAIAATTAALSATTHLTTATVVATTAGSAGNALTITLANTGTGTVVMTNVGSAWTAKFQAGVNTVSQLNTALAAAGMTLGGSYTGSNVLSSGDAVGPIAFTGGYDQVFQVRHSSVTTYSWAAGTWTNCLDPNGASIDGEWEYIFTQAELNFTGGEVIFRAARAGVIAELTQPEPMQNTVEVSTVDVAAVAQIWDGSYFIEGSYTPADLIRLDTAVLAGPAAGFGTGSVTFNSLDNSKTRLTSLDPGSGRTPTVGTLT